MGLTARACVAWGGLTVKCVEGGAMALEFGGGGVYIGGKAIVLYLARLAGLLSNFPDDALPVEEHVFKTWDAPGGVVSLFGMHIPTFAAGGHVPTLADVALYVHIKHKGMQNVLHLYPTMHEWYAKIDARLRI